MWNDIPSKEIALTPIDAINKYEQHPRITDNPLRGLSTKERAHIRAELEGVSPKRYGFNKDSSIFDRPKVAVALERILDEVGLSDKRLAKRIKQIIFYGQGANADNVAHNAIRTVWQIKGKFAPEKHEVLHRSDLENLSDEQLDKIINAGLKEVKIMQVKLGCASSSSVSP